MPDRLPRAMIKVAFSYVEQPEPTELYRRAGYLITLTDAPAWEKKFDEDIDEIREAAEEEFAKTARVINRRAEAVGTEANYDERWGD